MKSQQWNTPRKNKFNIMDWIDKPKPTPEKKTKKAKQGERESVTGQSQHDGESNNSENEEEEKKRTENEQDQKEEAARVEKERQKAMAAKEQALVGNEIEAMIQMSLKSTKKTGPAENLIMMNQDKDDEKI